MPFTSALNTPELKSSVQESTDDSWDDDQYCAALKISSTALRFSNKRFNSSFEGKNQSDFPPPR